MSGGPNARRGSSSLEYEDEQEHDYDWEGKGTRVGRVCHLQSYSSSCSYLIHGRCCGNARVLGYLTRSQRAEVPTRGGGSSSLEYEDEQEHDYDWDAFTIGGGV